MKKIITKEEYDYAISRINFIMNEKDLLEKLNKNKTYNAHINLPGTFGELIINIKRENDKIDNALARIKNHFLAPFKQNKKLYKQLKSSFNEFINLVLNSNSNKFPSQDDNFMVHELMQYDTFSSVALEIFELLKRKQGNDSLRQYVTSLDNELQEMLTIKNTYESQQKHANCKMYVKILYRLLK